VADGGSQKPSQPKRKPAAAANDTVQLSTIAQAALQEAIETFAQTTKEANSGDRQAKRVLAKETASQVGKK
jgi:hypothetical protein